MEESDRLWRYMSLAKYIDLISSREIFCSRADLFEDRTEGEWLSQILNIIDEENEKFWKKGYFAIRKVNELMSMIDSPNIEDYRSAFTEFIDNESLDALNISNDVDHVLSEESFNSMDERSDYLKWMEEKTYDVMNDQKYSLSVKKKKLNELKARSFISSWHISNRHNMAMWKIYGLGEESVAITTTRGKLSSIESANSDLLFANDMEIYFRDVSYIDRDSLKINSVEEARYLKETYESINNFKYKHRAFEYEKEHRIILTCREAPDFAGVRLSVGSNINDFIDYIYFNPALVPGHWFITLLEHINRIHGVDNSKIIYDLIRTDYSV